MARKKRLIGYGIVQCDCCKGKRYMRINYSGKSTKPKAKTVYKSFNNMAVSGNDHHCTYNSFNNEDCAYRFKLNVYIPAGSVTDNQKETLEKLCDTYATYDDLFFDDETSEVQDSATYDKETDTYTCPFCNSVIPDPNVNGITECPVCGAKLVTTPNDNPPDKDDSVVSLIARQDKDGNFICPECERIIENPVINGISTCSYCGTKCITKTSDIGTLVATYKADEKKFYCSVCNVELVGAKIGTTMRCENCGSLMLISYVEENADGSELTTDIPSATYIESINGFECPNCNELITDPVIGGITVCGVCNTNSITVLPDGADTSKPINDVPYAIYNAETNTYTCPNNKCNYVFTDLSITGYTKCPQCGLYSISNDDYEIITYPDALYNEDTGEYICFSCGAVLVNPFLDGETTCPNCGSINTTKSHGEGEEIPDEDADNESEYPDAIYDSMNNVYYCSNDNCNRPFFSPVVNWDNICSNCAKYSFIRKFRPGITKDHPYALFNDNTDNPSNNVCPNCKKVMEGALEGALAKCKSCGTWSYVTEYTDKKARLAVYDTMADKYYCFSCGTTLENPTMDDDMRCPKCNTLIFVSSEHPASDYPKARYNGNPTDKLNNKCPHCNTIIDPYVLNTLNRCTTCGGWSYVVEYTGEIENLAVYDSMNDVYYCHKCGAIIINPTMDTDNKCSSCNNMNYVSSEHDPNKDYPYATYNSNDGEPINNICPTCGKVMGDSYCDALNRCKSCGNWSYVTAYDDNTKRLAVYDTMNKNYHCYECGTAFTNPTKDADNTCPNCSTLNYVSSSITNPTGDYPKANFNGNLSDPVNSRCPHCNNIISDYVENSLNKCNSCGGWSYVTKYNGNIPDEATYDSETKVYSCYNCEMPFVNPTINEYNTCNNCGKFNFIRSQE